MAATLRIDTLKESEFESSREGVRIIRSAIVYGMDTSASYAVMTNSLAAAGMPRIGEQHPTIGGCYVIGYRIRFETDAITRVGVIYESPRIGSGGPPNQWQIKDSNTLVSIQTSRHPTLGLRLYTNFKNPGDGNDPGTAKTATVQFLRPLRVITAKGNFQQRLSDEQIGVLGTVNDSVFLGYAAGFWMVNGIEQETRDGGQTWDCSVSFISNVVEDWSSYAVQFNDRGEPVAINDADVQQLEEFSYLESVTVYNGISKFGLYPTAPHSRIFVNIQKRFDNPGPTGAISLSGTVTGGQ